MRSGRRRHYVPQMMIRAFADSDGALHELIKSRLALGTRVRRPKKILYADDMYIDSAVDLDEELFKPIEQRFQQVYPILASGDAKDYPQHSDAGYAFIEWIASMMCRMPGHELQLREILGKSEPTDEHAIAARVLQEVAPQLLANMIRVAEYERIKDLLCRPRWKWAMKTWSEPVSIVLTDMPVCYVRTSEESQLVIICPISSRRVLFGGLEQDIDKCRNWDSRLVNVFLAGWAVRHIFSRDRRALHEIIEDLSGKGIVVDQNWCAGARRPLLGMLDRIKSQPSPSEDQVNELDERMKEAFGAPRS